MAVFDRAKQLVRTTGATTAKATSPVAPGKRTLTENLPVQLRASASAPQPTAPATRESRIPLQMLFGTGGAVEPVSRGVSSDSAGQAMPEALQTKMESSLGADFSAVRIHEGSSAQAIGALAYTQGTNVHFAPGQYQPDSTRGQELLGHELAHVVQQSQGRVQATTQAKGMAVNDDAGLEHEADDWGAKAARGEPISGTARSPVASHGREVTQCHLDTAMSAELSNVLCEHTTILSLMTQYNHWEGQLFEDDEVNPFAKSAQPKAMTDEQQQQILLAMDQLSGEIISQCLALKNTQQYQQHAALHDDWRQRFDRIIFETLAERQHWYGLKLGNAGKQLDYLRYYQSRGAIALLERVRAERGDLGSASEYKFLDRDALLHQAISMGYDANDLQSGIDVNYGITVGGPALTDAKNSAVSYMHINDAWIARWLREDRINDLIHTLEHEYRHVRQHHSSGFMQAASAHPGASLGEVDAYYCEITRFVERLKNANGDVTDPSLPSEQLVTDAVNAYLTYYDYLKEPRPEKFEAQRKKLDKVLFEINFNKMAPYRALLKLYLPDLYQPDDHEGSGYQML